jgi:hypothetical protein
MYPDYKDIRSRINEEPSWFDENGVPRYGEFRPRHSASIYISEIALAEISCQGCAKKFRVAFSAVNVRDRNVADAIRTKLLHYGDPPNVECCGSGPTMNSNPLRILEYWKRHHQEYAKDGQVTDVHRYLEWKRDNALEIDIKPDWAE